MDVSINTIYFCTFNSEFVSVAGNMERNVYIAFLCIGICHTQYIVIIICRSETVSLDTYLCHPYSIPEPE